MQDIQLEASNTGAMQPVSTRYDPRSGRFDVSFEIGNDDGTPPTSLRFTGIAIETVEAAVLTRDVERSEVLKSSDVVTERRPKAEVGGDAAAAPTRGRHAGAHGSFAPARRCRSPISPSRTWCSATTMSP